MPLTQEQKFDLTVRRFKKKVQEYRKSLNQLILTSRFNDSTWDENRCFVHRNKNVGCVYCSPSPLSSTIPLDATLFMLEMNNDTNKILGIGLVKNHPRVQKYSVYDNGNYNRYSFIGKNRIDRDDMTEEEEQIMCVFDILCFTGNTHMKRGQGLKLFPIEMLFKIKLMTHTDLVEFIRDMFRRRM